MANESSHRVHSYRLSEGALLFEVNKRRLARMRHDQQLIQRQERRDQRPGIALCDEYELLQDVKELLDKPRHRITMSSSARGRNRARNGSQGPRVAFHLFEGVTRK